MARNANPSAGEHFARSKLECRYASNVQVIMEKRVRYGLADHPTRLAAAMRLGVTIMIGAATCEHLIGVEAAAKALKAS